MSGASVKVPWLAAYFPLAIFAHEKCKIFAVIILHGKGDIKTSLSINSLCLWLDREDFRHLKDVIVVQL